jgi:hypothetical protein
MEEEDGGTGCRFNTRTNLRYLRAVDRIDRKKQRKVPIFV